MFGKYDRHAALMDGMAGRAGVAFDRSFETGALRDWQPRDAGLACAACRQADDCADRLATGEAGVPGYCGNRRLLRGWLPGIGRRARIGSEARPRLRHGHPCGIARLAP